MDDEKEEGRKEGINRIEAILKNIFKALLR